MRSSLVWDVAERWLLYQRCITCEKSGCLIYIAAEAINRAVDMYTFLRFHH